MVLILVAIVALIVGYAWFIEPGLLRVVRYRAVDRTARIARPIGILLLTDFHASRWLRDDQIDAWVAAAGRLVADGSVQLICLGGDFTDRSERYGGKIQRLWKGLSALGVPAIAVRGNHDIEFPTDPEAWYRQLAGYGMPMLRNEGRVVELAGQQVALIGMDDLCADHEYGTETPHARPWYRARAASLDWYAKLDGQWPGLPRIVLGHNPDTLHLPGETAALYLSGHTHGGQVWLWDWLSRIVPPNRYVPPGSFATDAGQVEVAGKTVVISRGLGGSTLPLRWLRLPELVLVELATLEQRVE